MYYCGELSDLHCDDMAISAAVCVLDQRAGLFLPLDFCALSHGILSSLPSALGPNFVRVPEQERGRTTDWDFVLDLSMSKKALEKHSLISTSRMLSCLDASGGHTQALP